MAGCIEGKMMTVSVSGMMSLKQFRHSTCSLHFPCKESVAEPKEQIYDELRTAHMKAAVLGPVRQVAVYCLLYHQMKASQSPRVETIHARAAQGGNESTVRTVPVARWLGSSRTAAEKTSVVQARLNTTGATRHSRFQRCS
jgi:hypothetical protein